MKNIPSIIIDTREQLPYAFSRITPRPETIRKALPAGDYSLSGFESEVSIERKSPSDLFKSMGKDRERFEREFQLLANYKFAALMIEDDWPNILNNPPEYSRMNPRAVFRTCMAWSVKYGVHVVWGHHRSTAEFLTFKLLENFWKYHGETKI